MRILSTDQRSNHGAQQINKGANKSADNIRPFDIEIPVSINQHLFNTAFTEYIISNAVIRMFRVHLLFELFPHLFEIPFRNEAFEYTELYSRTEV